jgi:SAM-dependent methyltransferase
MGPASQSAGWLGTALGSGVLEIEGSVLHDELADVFGFELLQVGRWGDALELCSAARTQHRRLVAPDVRCTNAIRANYDALPVASGSVEAVLLPHTLEHAPRPHDVLREADRVLMGDGHLLICGFNPLGPWGVRHRASGCRFPPVVERLLPEYRVRDWLRLLGFEVAPVRWYLFAPPWQGFWPPAAGRWLESRGRRFAAPLAGAYLLKARKRVLAMTPIRPVWQRTPKLVGGLAKPTSRSAA